MSEPMIKQGDLAPQETPKAAEGALPPEAMRALAEAKARREQASKTSAALEIGGRGGLDPVRYGDWEVKGIVSDF